MDNNYIVSARKYRPSTFMNVVGQKALTTTLKNAIASNKLAHAYLFCGPRGVGKTSCARIFAKTINCLNPTPDGEACNECESCRAFNEQRSYNIHELDAASNNSVDDIRSLIDQVRIPPPIGKYKVFIIDEVHMLSSAAFNAFLKTLEEPPHHAIFVLATTEKHKVLPTILSRCQTFDFARISIADIVEHLQYVATCEQVNAEPDALNVIAQKADGGMRDALSIFDQIVSFTNGNITYKAVIDNLNVLDYEYYFKLTEVILSGNVRAALLILNEILRKGFEGQNIITGLASHFRDLLVCKDESTLVLFEVGASIRERYKETAKQCPDAFLFKAIEIANNCDINYKASRNKRLLLELTLIQLCQLNQHNPAINAEKQIKAINVTDNNRPAQPSGGNKAVQQTTTSAPVTKAVVPQVPINIVPPKQANEPAAHYQPAAKRPPIGTSLKNIGTQMHAPKTAPQQIQVTTAANDFTEEELINYWNEFAGQAGQKIYLKNIMLNCKPVLKENFYFDIFVHNPGQQEELINNSIEILPFLREKLNNSKIQMRVCTDEHNTKKLAYTSAEKYNHLLKINPDLEELKNEFNLITD